MEQDYAIKLCNHGTMIMRPWVVWPCGYVSGIARAKGIYPLQGNPRMSMSLSGLRCVSLELVPFWDCVERTLGNRT